MQFSFKQHIPPYTNFAICSTLLHLLDSVPTSNLFYYDITANLITCGESIVLPLLVRDESITILLIRWKTALILYLPKADSS
ncbi:hypothetical protein A7P96_07760 [Eikenella sp. NML03-A-027]|uniref:hypothetical protein n=1 Tax=Eikenella sp. NML03-A-027 TaxID=1795828 RepID=UPI0007E2A0F8|nr:hypothetical protein [Eikenella sp. NML03-A-027]OAM30477.1 hypothetical protein A7P96_07760 [Eikenella sp. NML03-A-027]